MINYPIQITVLDRNDNDPVMAQRIYDVSISESAPLGSEIVKVVANDPGENSLEKCISKKLILSNKFLNPFR